MSVYLTVSKDEAQALAALLGGCVTTQVLSDIGLSKLTKMLREEFADAHISGKYGTVERGYSTTPVTIKGNDKDVYIVTD